MPLILVVYSVIGVGRRLCSVGVVGWLGGGGAVVGVVVLCGCDFRRWCVLWKGRREERLGGCKDEGGVLGGCKCSGYVWAVEVVGVPYVDAGSATARCNDVRGVCGGNSVSGVQRAT